LAATAYVAMTPDTRDRVYSPHYNDSGSY